MQLLEHVVLQSKIAMIFSKAKAENAVVCTALTTFTAHHEPHTATMFSSRSPAQAWIIEAWICLK